MPPFPQQPVREDAVSIRTLALGWVALVAVAAPADAADLGRMPVKAPVAVPAAFSWTGCYVGGFVGGAFSERDPVFTDLGNANFRAFSGGITAGRVENVHSWNVGLDDSFIGGGTLGCNWQPVGSAFVLGIEGEGGYLRLTGSTFDPLINPVTTVAAFRGTPDVLGSARIGDWYGMITGRIGYAFGSVLLYAKGGAAFLPVRASVTDNCFTVATGCGNWGIATAISDTVTAGTIGGGLEWAFAPNWSVKGEYMFIGVGDHTLGSCATATLASGAAVAGGPFCFNHDFGGIHTAKLGVNFRFGP